MSIDLHTYERLGDLEAPFTLTAKNGRRQRDRERLRESMRCDVAPLSFEEYRAGQPCPGCGRPYIDAELFENKGTMYFTNEERARYQAEETQGHPRFLWIYPTWRLRVADRALREVLPDAAVVARATATNRHADDGDDAEAAA